MKLKPIVSSFNGGFALMVFVINALGLIWAVNPQVFGMYVGLLFAPVNLLLALAGVLWVAIMQKRQKHINSKLK